MADLLYRPGFLPEDQSSLYRPSPLGLRRPPEQPAPYTSPAQERGSVMERLAAGEVVDPSEIQQLDARAMAQADEFSKGLRRFGYSSLATLKGFTGAVLEPLAPETGRALTQSGLQDMRDMPQSVRPAVENWSDVNDVRSFGQKALGTLGEGLPTLGLVLAGGLGGRGIAAGANLLGRRGAVSTAEQLARAQTASVVGGMAPIVPLESGETALELAKDPQAMANTTPVGRLGLSVGRGTLNAALENIVPQALILPRLLGRAARTAPGVRAGLRNVGAVAGEGALGEYGTEFVQELTGQEAQNLARPGARTPFDFAKAHEAGLSGALVGGVVGGGAGGVHSAYSNIAEGTTKTGEAVRRQRMPTMDDVIGTMRKYSDNPEQFGADVTNMTLGTIVAAPAFMRSMREMGVKGLDTTEDVFGALKAHIDDFVVKNITDPELKTWYTDQTSKLSTMTSAEYGVFKQALSATSGKEFRENLGLAARLWGRAALAGAKTVSSALSKVYEGAVGAVKARGSADTGKASLDRPLNEAETNLLAEFSAKEKRLAKWLTSVSEPERIQMAEVLNKLTNDATWAAQVDLQELNNSLKFNVGALAGKIREQRSYEEFPTYAARPVREFMAAHSIPSTHFEAMLEVARADNLADVPNEAKAVFAAYYKTPSARKTAFDSLQARVNEASLKKEARIVGAGEDSTAKLGADVDPIRAGVQASDKVAFTPEGEAQYETTEVRSPFNHESFRDSLVLEKYKNRSNTSVPVTLKADGIAPSVLAQAFGKRTDQTTFEPFAPGEISDSNPLQLNVNPASLTAMAKTEKYRDDFKDELSEYDPHLSETERTGATFASTLASLVSRGIDINPEVLGLPPGDPVHVTVEADLSRLPDNLIVHSRGKKALGTLKVITLGDVRTNQRKPSYAAQGKYLTEFNGTFQSERQNKDTLMSRRKAGDKIATTITKVVKSRVYRAKKDALLQIRLRLERLTALRAASKNKKNIAAYDEQVNELTRRIDRWQEHPTSAELNTELDAYKADLPNLAEKSAARAEAYAQLQNLREMYSSAEPGDKPALRTEIEQLAGYYISGEDTDLRELQTNITPQVGDKTQRRDVLHEQPIRRDLIDAEKHGYALQDMLDQVDAGQTEFESSATGSEADKKIGNRVLADFETEKKLTANALNTYRAATTALVEKKLGPRPKDAAAKDAVARAATRKAKAAQQRRALRAEKQAALKTTPTQRKAAKQITPAETVVETKSTEVEQVAAILKQMDAAKTTQELESTNEVIDAAKLSSGANTRLAKYYEQRRQQLIKASTESTGAKAAHQEAQEKATEEAAAAARKHARMQEISASTTLKGFTTSDDNTRITHKQLQNEVDGWVAKFIPGAKIKVIIFAARDGDTFAGFADDVNNIVAVSDYIATGVGVYSTLAHEFGHQIEYKTFDQAAQSVQDKIKQAYQRDLKQLHAGVTVQQALQMFGSARTAQGKTAEQLQAQSQLLSQPKAQYRTSFTEWFANQFSKYATHGVDSSLGLLEKTFWRKLVAKMDAFFEGVVKTLTPNATFAEWIDGLNKVEVTTNKPPAPSSAGGGTKPPKPPAPPGGKKGKGKKPGPPLGNAKKAFLAAVEQRVGKRVKVLFEQHLNPGVVGKYQSIEDALTEMHDKRRYALKELKKDWVDRINGESDAELQRIIDHADKNEKLLLEDKAVLGTIRVAAGREQQVGLAEHEAFHGAFTFFFNAQEKRILATAFTRGLVGRRLRAHFKGQPAVLAAIDNDSEEAAAYGYQLWVSNPSALQLGEGVRDLFQQFFDFMRKLAGILTTEEKARLILNDFDTGRRSEKEISPIARVLDKDLVWTQRAQNFAQDIFGLIGKGFDLVFTGAYDRVLHYENPALAKIATLGYQETGSDAPAGLLQRSRQKTRQEINYLNKLFEGLTEAELTQIHDAAIFKRPPTNAALQPKVDELKAWYRRMYEYQVAAGVAVKDAGKDYYPLPWDPEKVMKNKEAWLQMADKYADQFKTTMKTKHEVYESIVSYIERGDDFVGVMGKNNEPTAAATKVRTLAFITPKDRRPFMLDDPVQTAARYVQQAIRQAEFVRAYGAFGSKLESLKTEAKEKYGATAHELSLIDDYVAGLLGNKEIGMSRELKDLYGAMTVYQNYRLLPFSLFASLVDPLGIAVRSNSVGDAWETFTYSMKNLFREWKNEYTPDEWEKIAVDWGIIEQSGTTLNTENMHTGVTLRGTTRSLNDKLFKFNLLNGWVRSNTIMATKAAQRFFYRASEGMFNEHSERYLQEVGLTKDDVVFDAALDRILLRSEELQAVGKTKVEADAIEERLRSAMDQFVRQALLNPSSAELPNWASNPYLLPITHLKQFVWSFQATVTARILHELSHDNFKPAGIALMYVPGMIAADFVKDMISGFGDEPPYKKNWGVSDYLKQGVDRSGLTGVGQFFSGANEDIIRGGTGFESAFGPTYGQVQKGVRAFHSNSEVAISNWIIKSMPLMPVYKDIFISQSSAPITQ